MSDDAPTPERLLEMAEHIVEAIAHHDKYRELDVEILGETSRRLRLMAAAPDPLRAELDRLRAVEKAAAALVDAINVSQLDLSNSVRDAYYDLHVLLNGDVT